jgi:hypothetical protein
MRTVPSSDTLAIMPGTVGFHETQLTLREWPSSTVIGVSFFTFQM